MKPVELTTCMDIRAAGLPLRLIGWGAIIVILDFTFSYTTNGSGIQFDAINDVVGMALIMVGLFKIAKFDVDHRYRAIMTYLKLVAICCCMQAVLNHFIFSYPQLLSWIVSALGIAKLVAVVLFCLAMMQLSMHYELERSNASWKTSLILMSLIWIVPVGTLQTLGIYSLLSGEPISINFGYLMILLLGMMVIPVIHMFLSIKQMMNESANASLVLPT